MERKTKVLIADDDVNLRELLEEAVTDWGYEVRVADNGREALEKIKAEGCDIVICDLKMPVMDGLELLQKVKEFNRDILVIMITGYATLETAVKAVDQGAYDYITKPFRLDELKIIMKNAARLVELAARNRELTRKLEEAGGASGSRSEGGGAEGGH